MNLSRGAEAPLPWVHMLELETPAPGMTTPSASSGDPASASFALFDNAPVGSLDGTLTNVDALPQAPDQAAVGTGDMLWRGVHDAQLAGAPQPTILSKASSLAPSPPRKHLFQYINTVTNVLKRWQTTR